MCVQLWERLGAPIEGGFSYAVDVDSMDHAIRTQPYPPIVSHGSNLSTLFSSPPKQQHCFAFTPPRACIDDFFPKGNSLGSDELQKEGWDIFVEEMRYVVGINWIGGVR